MVCVASHDAFSQADLFANRTPLTGTNIILAASNTNATKELSEPNHAGNAGSASVWCSWTAPSNGDLVIDTDGSSFDTLLAIYTGSAVGALSLVASNDDHGASFINGAFTNGLFSTSRVRFQASAGTQYQIAVDGFNDGITPASGSIALSLKFSSQPLVRPTNDDFVSRITINGSAAVLTGSNAPATREPGEPFHANRMGDTSVWWTWTAPATDTMRITTEGSAFDTLLAVYTGGSLSNLSAVASNDDEDPANAVLTSAVIFEAAAAQTYQIVVDGFDGASGQIALHLDNVRTRLSAPTRLPDGTFTFVLTGLPGRAFDIETADHLGTWNLLTNVVNTNGSLLITDATAPSVPARSYRALMK
jgi:hypothetical protein